MKYALITVLFLIAGCASQLERINSEVNSYGYESDDVDGIHGIDLMTPEHAGDCEDHAHTKCMMIKEQMPDARPHMLWKLADGGAHMALEIDGFVLDNPRKGFSGDLYAYNEADWVHRIAWADCGAKTQ